MDFENGVSFVDRLVGYQKRFEEHAARLFISESTGWGLRFYGTGWEREESSDCKLYSFLYCNLYLCLVDY